MRKVIIDGNAVTDRSHGPDISDTIPCFTGQKECFSGLQCQRDGVAFLVVLTSSSVPFPQYSRLPLRLVELHKKQRPFPGAYSFLRSLSGRQSHFHRGWSLPGALPPVCRVAAAVH